MGTAHLFAQFEQRLRTAGGEAVRVANLVAAAEFIATHPALATGRLVVPPAFAQRHPWGAILPLLSARGLQIREADTPAGIADEPAGLSSAELAIAESGSVFLADNLLAARSVSMLTLTHFVLVAEEHLVAMLDEAALLLQQLTRPGPEQQHYISLVTGPSRTADIERTLTIGVQGPRALCAIIVGETSGDLSALEANSHDQ
jgi:L-lactate dehydrogenase complex protein LldG